MLRKFYRLPENKGTLPETDSSPLKMMGFPIGISKLPGVYFQVRTVSFREDIIIAYWAARTGTIGRTSDVFFGLIGSDLIGFCL